MAAETGTHHLRRAVLDDVTALAELKLTSFCETFLEDFAIPYPADDLARFQAATYSPEQVQRELLDESHATWVAANETGRLLAYAHAGPCKLPHPEATDRSGELYQIYLRRDAQGMGLGKALLDVALDWIAQAYPGPQWLGVWSGNLRAQAFYAKEGFVQVGTYHFMVGDHRDDELIYRRD